LTSHYIQAVQRHVVRKSGRVRQPSAAVGAHVFESAFSQGVQRKCRLKTTREAIFSPRRSWTSPEKIPALVFFMSAFAQDNCLLELGPDGKEICSSEISVSTLFTFYTSWAKVNAPAPAFQNTSCFGKSLHVVPGLFSATVDELNALDEPSPLTRFRGPRKLGGVRDWMYRIHWPLLQKCVSSICRVDGETGAVSHDAIANVYQEFWETGAASPDAIDETRDKNTSLLAAAYVASTGPSTPPGNMSSTTEVELFALLTPFPSCSERAADESDSCKSCAGLKLLPLSPSPEAFQNDEPFAPVHQRLVVSPNPQWRNDSPSRDALDALGRVYLYGEA
jgi:hypothetical protein